MADGFLAGGLNFFRTSGDAHPFQGDKAGGSGYFSRSLARFIVRFDDVGVSFFLPLVEQTTPVGVNIPPLPDASFPYLGVAC